METLYGFLKRHPREMYEIKGPNGITFMMMSEYAIALFSNEFLMAKVDSVDEHEVRVNFDLDGLIAKIYKDAEV